MFSVDEMRRVKRTCMQTGVFMARRSAKIQSQKFIIQGFQNMFLISESS